VAAEGVDDVPGESEDSLGIGPGELDSEADDEPELGCSAGALDVVDVSGDEGLGVVVPIPNSRLRFPRRLPRARAFAITWPSISSPTTTASYMTSSR
jgi:hypothetical protein